MDRREFVWLTLGCGALAVSRPAAAAKAPENWDGLVRVKSKKLQLVYLQPGADFRGYTKVMIDPTEVAFRKNWARDYNTNAADPSRRVSDADVQKATQQGAAKATDIFASAFTKAGFPVVQTPGPDVLRVRTAVFNIELRAPDVPAAGRSRSFASEAGEASLMVEARDSETGALIGRAVDRRLAGDTSMLSRTSVSNRADFRTLVEAWAKDSARGLTELKALSPVGAPAGQ